MRLFYHSTLLKSTPDFSAFLKKSLAKNFTGYHTLSGSPTLPRGLYVQARTRRLGLRPGTMQTDPKPDFTSQALSSALGGSRRLRLRRGAMQTDSKPDFTSQALSSALGGSRRLRLCPGSMQTDSKPDFTSQALSAALEGSQRLHLWRDAIQGFPWPDFIVPPTSMIRPRPCRWFPKDRPARLPDVQGRRPGTS